MFLNLNLILNFCAQIFCKFGTKFIFLEKIEVTFPTFWKYKIKKNWRNIRQKPQNCGKIKKAKLCQDCTKPTELCKIGVKSAKFLKNEKPFYVKIEHNWQNYYWKLQDYLKIKKMWHSVSGVIPAKLLKKKCSKICKIVLKENKIYEVS